MPAPDAQEGGESAWEHWQEASRRLDLAFAPTEPSSLAPMSTGSALAQLDEAQTRPHLLSADALMVVARRNNRVCPRPAHWSDLYQILKGERHADLAAPPLQPWLWTRLSGLQKRLRFREHIEWAQGHGRLEQVARFMNGLTEGDWLHMGESESA
jgi:hypothetical protein